MTKTDGWLVKVGYEHYFMSEMDAKMLMGISKRSVHVSYNYNSDQGGFVSTAKELQEHYGVTRRRAAFISLDQNNKATASFDRVRQIELGLRATWRHSRAGKEPRPTHVAMDGKEYDPAKGMYDPDPKVRRWILPGELPRCRCFSRAIVKGLS